MWLSKIGVISSSKRITPPAAPSSVAIGDFTSLQCVYAFADNATDETGYDVHMQINGGGFSFIFTLEANDNTGVFQIDDYGGGYSDFIKIRVRATKTGAEPSAWAESNEIQFTGGE